MNRFSITFFVVSAVFALIVGVIFAFPGGGENFTRIRIGAAEILAEVAKTPYERSTGLAGRESIGWLRGMLFVFEKAGHHGIWMKGMRFPIDIVWIKNGRIVDLVENAKPQYGVSDESLKVYMPTVIAEYVLETGAGFIAKNNLVIGQEVKIYEKSSNLVDKTTDSVGAKTAEFKPARFEPQFYEKYYIENLKVRPAEGEDFSIGRMLAETHNYRTYQIFYRSRDLTLSGVMNLPVAKPPARGYPVLVLNHGLIPAEIYYTGRGSKREQDFFAKNGYVTIHPDYRGHALSNSNPEEHHDFYVGYTQDVVSLIGALKNAKLYFMDLERIGMWGHSMGGGIAARIAVLRPEIRAYVLFAPISAYVEDNFYELSETETKWLSQAYGKGEAARRIYDKISPIMYFKNVVAPVQLHHAPTDKDVPIGFSEKMYDVLKRYGKRVEFYSYSNEKHEFIEAWPVAAARALKFFDTYVKNAR